MKYQNMIGDGKFPNKYFVFHYDEKLKRNNVPNPEREFDDEIITGDYTGKNYLGCFKTYQEALTCVNRDAFLPHVVIEDRLSGHIFEQIVYVCPCCGKEDYETFEDIKYTREKMIKDGYEFK